LAVSLSPSEIRPYHTPVSPALSGGTGVSARTSGFYQLPALPDREKTDTTAFPFLVLPKPLRIQAEQSITVCKKT